MSAQAPAILLMGPTASGKTAIAIELARRFPLELISVDSAQVFRDMNVGTAKPDAATLRACPHHLIDIISPEEAYSAAQFRADALRLMSNIGARGRTPLLVGGTMLYYKALLEGLAELPSASPETRAEIDAIAAAHGWPHVHALLAEVDPVTAARLSPNDAQRLQRALEIYRVSQRPMSAWLAETEAQRPPYRFLSLGLAPSDRSVLHRRIEQRFDAMLANGLEDEVSSLRQRYRLNLNLPSMRCVGYRQVWETQDGLAPRTDMRDRGIYATRQLAKRQLTWMNNTLQPERFDCLDASVDERIMQRVDAFLA
ncbi:tRNA (adenosine(37)-N6)-dimethylallyltransferase MiaA [Propionivibrio dicarboxylicus]|uniref:tRNA dimethylallyltransferase n=1 Tax=Propionivibrio dicarboxylicus TaxID=83767 RepID=A0A1G8M5I8_9RHOO|nr:tRNA (adenosine(37)-N6)-dimethylallyltransferase MiaA [Propionivibrio dicarboxylicus]SDI63212.1 tRNA dimethylallyltransferase [Propionivibrio dicarboxylicus]